MWRGRATGWSCRCRWPQCAAERPLPEAETTARQIPDVSRAGKRGPRRPDRVRSTGSAGKKATPVGENRSRVATVELLDRVRGLGDKPVRINLTHTIWGLDWDAGLKKL